GNYRLAHAVAEEVARLLPPSIASRATPEWASAQDCARRLGVTDWDRLRVYENIRQRETEAPFTLQLNHTNQIKTLTDKLADIRSRRTPEAAHQARELYRRVLGAQPDDFLLHGNFAKLLEDNGDFSG